MSIVAPKVSGELAVTRAMWGFEVDWSKRPVFNTRIESMVGGSPMWREAAVDGRCIVPVASFFEPHATETVPSPRTGRPLKRPYEFIDPAGLPLLLAGVQADGRCSIVTCEPNGSVAPVHDRMPLVMRFQEVPTWLSPDWPALASRDDVNLLARPERLEPPEPPEPSAQLSLF